MRGSAGLVVVVFVLVAMLADCTGPAAVGGAPVLVAQLRPGAGNGWSPEVAISCVDARCAGLMIDAEPYQSWSVEAWSDRSTPETREVLVRVVPQHCGPSSGTLLVRISGGPATRVAITTPGPPCAWMPAIRR